jgi:hypothetical protein
MRPRVSILFLSLTSFTFAWGPEGHNLVARIAESQLTPAAHAQVVEILGAGRTMSSVANWADEVRPSRRETAPWHFVDIPIEKSHFDAERDCAKGDCVVSAITRFRAVLRDPAASPEQRREALEFVIHFIGDMHQPLHSSDHDDKGGNTVQVLFHDRRTNLHSLWDSGMLGRLGSEDDLFPALSLESARHRKRWAKGTVTQWAEQSHKVSQKVVYGKLPKESNGSPATIDAAYEAAAAPVLREQIERAGARLAAVLNADLR